MPPVAARWGLRRDVLCPHRLVIKLLACTKVNWKLAKPCHHQLAPSLGVVVKGAEHFQKMKCVVNFEYMQFAPLKISQANLEN